MKVIIDRSIIETDFIYKIDEIEVLSLLTGCSGVIYKVEFSIYMIGTSKPININKPFRGSDVILEDVKGVGDKAYDELEKARNELISLWSNNQKEFKVIEL